MYRRFLRYVIPSMIGFALSGVYAIVDGYFIGNSIGDIGLAAINVAFPLTSLMQCLGCGIGLGGAINYAISDGAGNHEERNRYLWVTIGLLNVSILALIALYIPFARPILRVFGAEGELLSLCEEYIKIIIIGIPFQILGTGLVPFMRNMGGSFEAMIAMILGFVGNVGFDYLLVWKIPWGMTGAAIASVLGQAFSMAFAMWFFYTHRYQLRANLHTDLKPLIIKILKVGVSPFGLTLIPNIAPIFINKAAFIYGGDLALSTYAVISYAICVAMLLLQGISDGAQPLISIHYGAKEYDLAKKVRNISYITSTIMAIVSMWALYHYRFIIPLIFGGSEEVIAEVARSMNFFTIGLIFVGISRTTISYFYATEKNKLAYILIYLEPVILLLAIIGLSVQFDLDGTWYATAVTQFLIAILSLWLLHYNNQTTNRKEMI